MRLFSRNLFPAAIGLCLCAAGCATSSPYEKSGFDVQEKNGRIYVFHPDSPQSRKFARDGQIDRAVTLVGAGPDGKTVVGEDREVLDDYLGK